MWVPKRLVIENFMAFESQEYSFLEGHAVMVQGKNLTDDGQDSNGSCKSAILEAMGIALTGKCIRLDTSAKDLVRNGEKQANITFSLENILTKQHLEIVREVFSNTKSATLDIFVDGSPLKDITSVNEGNDRIIELIGIERDDLLNYYLISKERYVPFYKQSDSKKKEVIARFSNADMVTPVEEILDQNIIGIQERLDVAQHDIEKNLLKIETYENDMGSFSVEEMKEKRDNKIKSLNDSIESYTKKIEETNNEIEELEKQEGDLELEGQDFVIENPDNSENSLDECNKLEGNLRKDLSKFDVKNRQEKNKLESDKESELQLISKKEKDLKKELEEIRDEKKEADKLLSDVDKSLMSSVECPKCSHEFSPSNKKINVQKAKEKRDKINSIVGELSDDIDEIQQEISDLDNERSKIRDKYKKKIREVDDKYDQSVKDIRKQLDDIDAERKQIKAESKRISEALEEIINKQDDVKKKIRTKTREIKSYNDEITSLNSEIKTVEDQVIENRQAEFKDKIDVIKKLNKSLDKKMSEIESELQKAKEEKEVFIRFKTHLSNKAIAAIEAHSNNYLEVAKSNIRIQMDGYKQNKSGEIREKITTTVFRDGISEGGIGKFSSGEKARIEVSNILAMKKMINNSSPTGGLDLLVIDEITNSLDSTGVGGIMDMLEETKETTIHITHATFHSIYPHIITVVKDGNVSEIHEGQYEEVA